MLPSRWDSRALVHFTTAGAALSSQAGKFWEQAHPYALSGKLLSGTALQCDPLDMQLVYLSHLGFAQLLAKMTHLLLTTLEYFKRANGF